MESSEHRTDAAKGGSAEVPSEPQPTGKAHRWSHMGRVRWGKLGLRLAIAGWVLLVATGFYALGDPQPGPDFERRVAAKLEVVQLFMVLIGLCFTGSLVSAVVGLFSPSRTRSVVALLLVLAAISMMLVSLWSQITGAN